MVAKILLADPLHDPMSQKVKIQLFHKMVMLHIKLNRIKKQLHRSKYFARALHTHPGDGVHRSEVIFFRTWLCCLSN